MPDAADAVDLYDRAGLAMLRVGLSPDKSQLVVRLPDGLDQRIPMTLRGLEILKHLLELQSTYAEQRTVGTRPVPTQEILNLWAKEKGNSFPVRKFKEGGKVSIDDLEIEL